jgi:hypothetical protein
MCVSIKKRRGKRGGERYMRRENVCDRRRKCKKKGIYMREREKVCVCVKEQKSKERGS